MIGRSTHPIFPNEEKCVVNHTARKRKQSTWSASRIELLIYVRPISDWLSDTALLILLCDITGQCSRNLYNVSEYDGIMLRGCCNGAYLFHFYSLTVKMEERTSTVSNESLWYSQHKMVRWFLNGHHNLCVHVVLCAYARLLGPIRYVLWNTEIWIMCSSMRTMTGCCINVTVVLIYEG